ncbi:hypothetical protein FTO74_00945 [Granulicella sp. WH15]|uniref:hypothetical protein n=1 Tax=Granulicella sp. WH15 TaxID=2602070 RepID=UPI00136737DF|nr:hypothetical protein [Granulicella sp. WH15]QHN02104.1 hypothetical protein FTO74_00945 [Granulicella sp. WH15]
MSVPNPSTRAVWTEAERREAVARAKANIEAHNQSSPDPNRKSFFAPSNSLFVATGVAFILYAFNVGGFQDFLDGFFSKLILSVQFENKALAAAIPHTWMTLLVFSALLGLFLVVDELKFRQRARSRAARKPITMEEFIGFAAQHHISATVAEEAYKLLLPHYLKHLRTRLTDSLSKDLQLTPTEHLALYRKLLSRTNRTQSDPAQIETVLDLLTTVEASSPRFATQLDEESLLVAVPE